MYNVYSIVHGKHSKIMKFEVNKKHPDETWNMYILKQTKTNSIVRGHIYKLIMYDSAITPDQPSVIPRMPPTCPINVCWLILTEDWYSSVIFCLGVKKKLFIDLEAAYPCRDLCNIPSVSSSHSIILPACQSDDRWLWWLI